MRRRIRCAVVQGGMLQRLLDGAATIQVNSLHGQGIDRLADGLAVEAVAPDGTIEAVSVQDAPGFRARRAMASRVARARESHFTPPVRRVRRGLSGAAESSS